MCVEIYKISVWFSPSRLKIMHVVHYAMQNFDNLVGHLQGAKTVCRLPSRLGIKRDIRYATQT